MEHAKLAAGATATREAVAKVRLEAREADERTARGQLGKVAQLEYAPVRISLDSAGASIQTHSQVLPILRIEDERSRRSLPCPRPGRRLRLLADSGEELLADSGEELKALLMQLSDIYIREVYH